MDRTSADITGPGAEDTRGAAVPDLPNAPFVELPRLPRGFLSRQNGFLTTGGRLVKYAG